MRIEPDFLIRIGADDPIRTAKKRDALTVLRGIYQQFEKSEGRPARGVFIEVCGNSDLGKGMFEALQVMSKEKRAAIGFMDNGRPL